jgi:hypothetical protein
MIDLAARIADAVKAIDDDGKRYVTVKIAVDRWLFLDMAARIEELEKALEATSPHPHPPEHPSPKS